MEGTKSHAGLQGGGKFGPASRDAGNEALHSYNPRLEKNHVLKHEASFLTEPAPHWCRESMTLLCVRKHPALSGSLQPTPEPTTFFFFLSLSPLPHQLFDLGLDERGFRRETLHRDDYRSREGVAESERKKVLLVDEILFQPMLQPFAALTQTRLNKCTTNTFG